MLEVPPANHCVAVPPAPVLAENPVPPPPLHQLPPATTVPTSALAQNPHQFAVIVENTELLQIVPLVVVPPPAPPAPMVTE